MNTVPITALGIAAAAALGAILGDRFGMSEGRWKTLLKFVGLVMLCVILVGILLPLWQGRNGAPVMILLFAVICGGELLGDGLERSGFRGISRSVRSLLLVGLIALHHIPEGMAAGLACTEGTGTAVCAAVVLHTIPETLVIPPLMAEGGFGRRWGFAASAVSGAMEIIGVLAGACLSI